MDIPTAESVVAALTQATNATAIVEAVQAIPQGVSILSVRLDNGTSVDFNVTPLGPDQSATLLASVLSYLQAQQASATAALTAII